MARYMVKFKKCKGIKFISHLDLMRAFQRGIRRAEIPVTYSKGFNPHAEFSFATPLPVGTWSVGEYLEIGLDSEIDCSRIAESLNKELPEEIRVLSVKKLSEDAHTLMSIVDAASYEITLSGVSQTGKAAGINQFLGLETIVVEKTGKNGTRNVDIKPMIRSMGLESETEDTAVLRVEADCGSRSNLSIELLYEALKKYAHGFEASSLRDIAKLETYAKKDNAMLVPLELI